MSDNEEHYDEDDEHEEGGEEGSGGRNQGRWSREEHAAFIEGLRLHGREWKKIALMIPTRTVVQIRTHAQKFFQKQAKNEGRNVDYDGGSSKIEHKQTGTGGDKKRLKVTAPQSKQESSNGGNKRVQEARSATEAPGGITPRTVAAATILLAPRFQSDKATPHTSQWMAQQSASAAVILDPQRTRRTSPRLAPYHLPPSWPSHPDGTKANSLFNKTAVEPGV